MHFAMIFFVRCTLSWLVVSCEFVRQQITPRVRVIKRGGGGLGIGVHLLYYPMPIQPILPRSQRLRAKRKIRFFVFLKGVETFPCSMPDLINETNPRLWCWFYHHRFRVIDEVLTNTTADGCSEFMVVRQRGHDKLEGVPLLQVPHQSLT